MTTTLPAATFPALPASAAWAGTSAVSSPGWMAPSSVVSNRTRPAVMHTVPTGMVRAASAVSPAVKRMTPVAGAASFRVMPRSWAWRSKNSPSAVWGSTCRPAQSAWTYRLYTWAATAYSRAARSQPSAGRIPVR